MLNSFLVLTSFFLLTQGFPAPKVWRVSVNTPHDASIIFEYAYTLLPEDEPLKRHSVTNFIAQLRATGLFLDVKVKSWPTKYPGKVEVVVTPNWHPDRDRFIINDVILVGGSGVNEAKVLESLSRHGVGRGSPLLRVPVQRMKQLLRDAVREIYGDDPRKVEDFVEKFQDPDVSVRIKQVSSARFNIIINALGQSGGELRARYGPPLEAYEISPHVLMTVRPSGDGQSYEYVIEARHASRDEVAGESLMSLESVREIVDEVAPLPQRGRHVNSSVFRSSCNALGIETYEHVEIRTFTTCPSAGGNRVASVTIRWTKRRPKD
jgi:hypothetical protein